MNNQLYRIIVALIICTNIILTSHNYHKKPHRLYLDIIKKQQSIDETRKNLTSIQNFKPYMYLIAFVGTPSFIAIDTFYQYEKFPGIQKYSTTVIKWLLVYESFLAYCEISGKATEKKLIAKIQEEEKELHALQAALTDRTE